MRHTCCEDNTLIFCPIYSKFYNIHKILIDIILTPIGSFSTCFLFFIYIPKALLLPPSLPHHHHHHMLTSNTFYLTTNTMFSGLMITSYVHEISCSLIIKFKSSCPDLRYIYFVIQNTQRFHTHTNMNYFPN